MEGGELYEAVGQRATFCESEVKYPLSYSRNYMRILIDAIRYCHEMKVAHRDIKVPLVYPARKSAAHFQLASGAAQTGGFRHK